MGGRQGDGGQGYALDTAESMYDILVLGVWVLAAISPAVRRGRRRARRRQLETITGRNSSANQLTQCSDPSVNSRFETYFGGIGATDMPEIQTHVQMSVPSSLRRDRHSWEWQHNLIHNRAPALQCAQSQLPRRYTIHPVHFSAQYTSSLRRCFPPPSSIPSSVAKFPLAPVHFPPFPPPHT